MNFSSNEIILEAQRGRQWSPLITQQLRLRHINQLWCFNLKAEGSRDDNFYFTLHLNSSIGPFFTSEKTHGPHPKWQDLTMNSYPSASAFVLRIWRQGQTETDNNLALTWGLNLTGLVHIGNKVTEIQPSLFSSNTVIIYMFGGFFTSKNCLKIEFERLPRFSDDKLIVRRTSITHKRVEVKQSYTLDKLRKLHYLEVIIKNKSLDVQLMQDQIAQLDVLSQKSEINIPTSPTKNTTQLLTMNCLNRMLQVKPTKMQKLEMFKINKKIEVAKFRTQLLKEEKQKKIKSLERLKNNHAALIEQNAERESTLMNNYHILNKEKEKLKIFQKIVLQHRELLVHTSSQLQHRKRQLLRQLLWIYPIKEVSDKKYLINGLYLPNADMLSDATDDGISVALGYVAHIILMCSIFLQVPLRYPVTHYGSRSTINDQISPNLPEREFPLFTKGKDRMQFTYGVYLLNKNIAQLRWLYFMHTPDLKLTLPNLLNFLQGYKEFKQERFMLLKSSSNSLNDYSETVSDDNASLKLSVDQLRKLPELRCYTSCQYPDPLLERLKQESRCESPAKSKVRTSITGQSCASTSEIFAIPEAFLSKQLSTDSFKNYLSVSGDIGQSNTIPVHSKLSCDIPIKSNVNVTTEQDLSRSGSVEEGTDLLNPNSTLTDLIVNVDEEKEEVQLNGKKPDQPKKVTKEQQEFMQNWLRTGPALVCADRNLYPDEYLGSTSTESPLTARTDALLPTKSFNLVKPKH